MVTVKKQSTKNCILKIAQKLFAQEGYAAASINTIAKSINIAKPSIYHFFKNKQDLYCQTLLKASQELELKLSKESKKKLDTKEKLKNMIVAYLRFGLKHKNIFASAIQKVPSSETQIIQFIAKLRLSVIKHFEKIIREKATKEDTLLMTYLVVGTMDSFLKEKIFFKEKRWSLQKVAQLITNNIFQK